MSHELREGAGDAGPTTRLVERIEQLQRELDEARAGLAEAAVVIREGATLEERLRARVEKLEALLNTPEVEDFLKGVPIEAAHQRDRWGEDHDAKKIPEDWFWLLGYLGGKALRAHQDGDREKLLHHTVTGAAVFANWHRRALADLEKK